MCLAMLKICFEQFVEHQRDNNMTYDGTMT